MNKISEINSDRILYVDDLKINLLLFKQMFGKKFNIKCVDNPLKALELLKNNKFEIVI